MLSILASDSMAFYINEYHKKTIDDCKKMLLYTIPRVMEFAVKYDEKDSSLHKN